MRTRRSGTPMGEEGFAGEEVSTTIFSGDGDEIWELEVEVDPGEGWLGR